MRTALATLFALSLCATPLAGQERHPRTGIAPGAPAFKLFSIRPAVTEPCIENQPCSTNEGVSTGKRQALFAGGGAALGALLAYAVCSGSERARPEAEGAKKEGACSQSLVSISFGGAFVGALAGHVAFQLTKADNAVPASQPVDALTFRIPIG